MKIIFKQERVTKNTVRFTEVPESDMDVIKIGSLYVQKATLKEVGFQEGKDLIVELTVK